MQVSMLAHVYFFTCIPNLLEARAALSLRSKMPWLVTHFRLEVVHAPVYL